MTMFLRIQLVAVAVVLSSTVYAQRNLVRVTINDQGYESLVSYLPRQNSFRTSDGLQVIVSPISAEQLNAMFTAKSGFDGRHHLVRYTQSVQQFYSSQQGLAARSSYDLLKQGLAWMQEKGRITAQAQASLMREVNNDYYQQGLIELPVEDLPSKNNPYCISDKYLSVFQVDVSNTTDKPVVFRDSFVVRDQFETLAKLSPEFISQGLDAAGDFSVNKRLMLERYDLKNEFSVPARTSVTKYFATLPVDTDSDTLRILTAAGPVLKWAMKKDLRPVTKEYSFLELNVVLRSGLVVFPGSVYTVVVNAPADQAFGQGIRVLVNDEFIDEKIHVATLALVDGQVMFGERMIVPMSLMDLKRGKREDLVIDVAPVSGLRKLNP